MADVRRLDDLNDEAVRKILQDFNKDESLEVIKLQDYFDVLKKYLEEAIIEMTYEQFESEVLVRRDVLFLFSQIILPLIFSTEKVNLSSWNSYHELEKKRESEITREPRLDDPKSLLELRRRFTGLVEEAAECNFI